MSPSRENEASNRHVQGAYAQVAKLDKAIWANLKKLGYGEG